jgi:HEAT repeat protein
MEPFRKLLLAVALLVSPGLAVVSFAQDTGGTGGGSDTGGDSGTPAPPPDNRYPPGSDPLEDSELPRWSVWWSLNQNLFFDLRSHIHSEESAYQDDGFFLGHGARRTVSRSVLAPSAADVAESVLPLLEKTLAEERSSEVRRACLFALARTVRSQDPAEQLRVLALIRPHLSDAGAEVSESATLALGVVGHFTTASLLTDLLLDTDAGRRAVGRGEVPYRTRAFAAYALGLLGLRAENEDVRRFAVHHLARSLEPEQGRWQDLQVASAIAIGMIPLTDRGEELIEAESVLPPSASRAGQIRFLLDIFEDDASDKLLRAHAAGAVGRLFASMSPPRREKLKAEVSASLLQAIGRGGDESREVLQSAVLSLGSIGDDDDDPADREIRRALMRVGDLHRDRDARNFALLSLGRIGAREGVGKSPGSGLAGVQRLLVTQLIRGPGIVRPWAALAMGVLAEGLAVRDLPPPPEFCSAVRSALRGNDSPQEAGAFCLAAGMLGDPGAVPLLLRHLQKTRNPIIRSDAAIGLALLPAREATDEIEQALEEAVHRPTLVESLAVAKALLGEQQAVHEIAAQLSSAQSMESKRATLIALGRIGDVRAIEPLAEAVRRPTLPSELRAAAICALGMVAEPDPLPWPTLFAMGTNFVAATETLYSSDERGVLNAR